MTTPPNTPYPGTPDPNDPQQGRPVPPEQPAYGQNAPQPQYGQPPIGQPQYGQNQPQYGQQSPYGYQSQPGAYGYPGQPAGYPGAEVPVPVAPKEIIYSFYLILAAGALSLIHSIIGSMNPEAMLMPGQLDDLVAQSEGMLDKQTLLAWAGTATLVSAVIAAGFYALVAFMIKQGRNWARILGTVFAALSLWGLAGGILPILYILLGAAGIVMAFLPPANEYFRAVAARKAALKYGR